jgi:hypothetical protein
MHHQPHRSLAAACRKAAAGAAGHQLRPQVQDGRHRGRELGPDIRAVRATYVCVDGGLCLP